MSVVPPPQPGRANSSQGPWDRRSAADLLQANFRTTMRGFDREEVRATLESVAADYRVLQLQNASLQRQLADLEAVLQAYQDAHSDGGAPLTDSRALQRANSDARAILMRAYTQAEETMARVTALTKDAERPLEKIEHDQNFRVLLASTVSELMAIVKAAEQNPYDFATPPPAAPPLLLEANTTRVTSPVVDAEPVARAGPVGHVPFAPRVQEPVVQDEPAAFVQYDSPFSLAQDQPTNVSEPELDRFDRVEPSPRGALVPIDFVPRTQRRSLIAVDAPSDARAPVDPMDSILKALDKAMVEIPTLRRE